MLLLTFCSGPHVIAEQWVVGNGVGGGVGIGDGAVVREVDAGLTVIANLGTK
jgi:hypothetical protein